MNSSVLRLLTVFLPVVCLVLILEGCSRTKREPHTGPVLWSTVVATVGDQQITVGEVLEQYTTLTMPGGRVPATPENAFQEVLYRKLAWVKSSTYSDYDPKEIHRLVKNRLHDVVMRYMFDDRISRHTIIPDSSIDSFYRENLASFTIPERRKATHILVSNNRLAWEAAGIEVSSWSHDELLRKAKQEIDRLYSLVQAGADIGELAGEFSHDSNSRDNRGSVGFFTYDEMVAEFSGPAFRLKVGQVSRPFETVYGWHFLRVDSIVPEEIQPLDDSLREAIYMQLKTQYETAIAQAFVDSIFPLAQYRWNEELLTQDVGDYDPHDWVCIVNGTDTIEATMLREAEMMYRVRARVSEVDPETRKQIIIGRATPFILSATARELGYFDHDTIKTAYQNFRRAEIINRIMRDRIPTKQQWDDEELRAYYDRHVSDYKSDRPLKVQQIVFSDSLQAVEVLAGIEAGADFAEIATRHSPGRKSDKEAAFDLGWIGREDISPEYFSAAWLMPLNTPMGPVRTKWGYHLINVVDRKPNLEFEAAKNDVRRRLRDEEYAKQEKKWTDYLTRGVRVERFEEVWSQIDFANPFRHQEPTVTPDDTEQPAPDTTTDAV